MSQPSVHSLYRRLETIGRGAYGSVHKGIHIPSGNLVALKIIDLDTPDDDVEDIQREVTLLTQLRDAPNVTKYFGCFLDGPRVWIIMELAQGGSVRDLMKITKDGTLEEKYVVVIVREVLLGLSYLHKSSIIHRDIKAANILITASGKVMICDFGVSALLATASSKRNTLMGTPNWMAPEVAQTVPAYDTRADIWSLGIMVYEMVKGSPPHVGVDKFKVIHLIPRVAPPRLNEGEGSKDMRDFVACCLKESPNDRLSADELGKTKWVKSAAKTPVTILKDLILRYEAWKQGGGTRESLAAPLPWEEGEDMDMLDGQSSDDPWAFDRLSRALDDVVDEDQEGNPLHPDTIRPPASKLPSSLRLLFEDSSAPAPESFRPLGPMHGGRATPNGPSARGLVTPDTGNDEIATARQANFAFPPRGPGARAKSKTVDTPGSEVPDGPPPLGPGIPSGLSAMSNGGDTTTASPVNGRGNASYREVRSTRGVPNIEIPPPIAPDINVDLASSNILSPPGGLSSAASGDTDATTASVSQPVISRKRSQTGTTVLSSRGGMDFQFPPASMSSAAGRTHHSKASPTRSSVSSVSSTHQNTSSLDALVQQPRKPPPSGPLPLPPSITRARSATALAEMPGSPHAQSSALEPPLNRKPSLSRNTSVAVMENIPTSPLVAPIKPFARSGRSRSGSVANSEGGSPSQQGTPNIPGLKDVLKIPSLSSEHQLGMTDLLPPSPVTLTQPRSTPPWNGALGSSSLSEGSQATTLKDVSPGPNVPSTPLRSNTPDRSLGEDSSLSAPADSSYSNAGTSFSSNASTTAFGPAMRPLDFSAIMGSHDATHAELARTVDDLNQWLSVIEVGLTGMLDMAGDEIQVIEEEQEEVVLSPGDRDAQLQVDDERNTGISVHDTAREEGVSVEA